jgi:hypothetical protein
MILCWLILLTGAYPLWLAWRANRGTTLLQAVNWSVGAWAAWLAALLASMVVPPATAALARYFALCLTGCAGVAVLGARRPVVGAWTFVVLGLLAVDLLPIAEGMGNLQLNPLRVVFLSATLSVGVLNYLPTRLCWAVLLLAIGCTVEVWMLVASAEDLRLLEGLAPFSRCLLAIGPLAALVQVHRGGIAATEFDRLWLAFRDRFGLVWGQRTLEQFNRAAAHAGWPVVLRWRGLRIRRGEAFPDPATEAEIVQALRALLKRFSRMEEDE